MASGGTGAATAAPTLNELALQIQAEMAAVEGGHASALAHAIRAGELLVEAKAQVSHGGWLPWLEEQGIPGRTATHYITLHANRQRVADLGSVNEALAAIREAKPKRKPPKPKPQARPGPRRKRTASDPAVIDWYAARRAEGLSRDQTVKASKERADYPGRKPLNSGTCTGIEAVLDYRDDNPVPPTTPKKKPPTTGGKRRRRIHEEIRTDGITQLREMRVKIAEATMSLEHYVLPGDIGLDEESQDQVASLWDELLTLAVWTDDALGATRACMNDLAHHRKVQAMQAIVAHPDTDEHERRAALLGIERMQARQARLEAKNGGKA